MDTLGDLDNKAEQKKAQELLEKFEAESRFHTFSGWLGNLVAGWLVAMSAFQLYAASIGVLTTNIQRTWHLLFALTAVFLLYPSSRKGTKKDSFSWLDLLFALLSVVVNGYLIVAFDQIVMRGARVTPL